MKDIVKKISTHIMIQAILAILFGLFLILFPQTTTMAMIYLLAGFLAVIGIISLISYGRNKGESNFVDSDLIAGIFQLLIALVMFIFPKTVAAVFSLLLGILVMLNGVLNMMRGLEIKKYGGRNWITILILNIIITIGGLIIIINPFASTVTFVLILGILLVAKGIADLVSYFLFTNTVKKEQ